MRLLPAVKTDRVTPIASSPSWRAKAVSFVVARLSLIHRENWPSNETAAGQSVTPQTALGLSAAWGCVNLNAGVQGTLPFEVWRNSPRTGHPERAPDHWLALLLNRPNPDQNRIDFLEFLAVSLELRGNAYARKVRLVGGGSIVSLVPYDPDDVYVSRHRSTGEIQYTVRDWYGNVETLPSSEIWHVRGFGGSPLGGLSTLAHGREVFGLGIALDRASASTFKNGIRPSGVVQYSDWLIGPRRAQAEAALEQFKGSANTGKPLMLEGGVTWTPMSFSPADAEMLSSRGFNTEEVCRFFETPPVLIGHTEKVSAWGTGIQEITLGWTRFGLRRRLKRLEASADQQLLSPEDRAAGYFLRYNIEALLRADSKGRSAFYEVMLRAGVMTINECRALEGLAPVPGGDVPRMQSQNVPIGAALTTIPVVSDDAD